MDFLRVRNGVIVDDRRKQVRLRGVNLGNWLLLEGYMLGGPNEPEHRIRRSLAQGIGEAGARTFFRRYQDLYIRASDFRLIRDWEFNVVRVPFNYRLFGQSREGNNSYESGWSRLDWVVQQCRKWKLYCLLDLHAAPGAQNEDWHSDSPGRAGLWTSLSDQDATVRLWRHISERYRDEPAIAGYDLLNEPNTEDKATLRKVYRRCVDAIRSTGDRHIVFIEGTHWSEDFESIDTLTDDQIAYSPHFYKPTLYTFNLNLNARYPGVIERIRWDKEALRRHLRRFANWASHKKRPILVGEFGINSSGRDNRGETRWVRDTVNLFESFGFHWTYWAYKTLAGHLFPNGLLHYPSNPVWLRREGPASGWENFGLVTAEQRRQILRAIDSRQFSTDRPILRELRRTVS